VTKIIRTTPIDIDTMIPLRVPGPKVSVADLIEIVNFAYEGTVTGYWEVDVISVKKATLTIGSLEHKYTYAFTIKDYSETDEGKEYEINVDTVRHGIEKILNGQTKIATRIVLDIQDNLAQNEISAIDHDSVDCVIQAGLFGEIVYG
jgi:hypothetical protein